MKKRPGNINTSSLAETASEFYNEDGEYSSVLSPTNIIETMPISNVPLHSVSSHHPHHHHAAHEFNSSSSSSNNNNQQYHHHHNVGPRLSTSACMGNLSSLSISTQNLPQSQPFPSSGSLTPLSAMSLSTPLSASSPMGSTTSPFASPSSSRRPNQQERSVFSVRRKPHAEVYGFVLWVSTFIGFACYLFYAFLPVEYLHMVGFTYYPDKYWALALPAYLIMAHVFYNVIFNALIFLKTKPLDSNYTYTDEFAAKQQINVLNAKQQNGTNRKSNSNTNSSTSNSNSVEDMDGKNQDTIPPIMDIPITTINKLLYQYHPAGGQFGRRASFVPPPPPPSS